MRKWLHHDDGLLRCLLERGGEAGRLTMMIEAAGVLLLRLLRLLRLPVWVVCALV